MEAARLVVGLDVGHPATARGSDPCRHSRLVLDVAHGEVDVLDGPVAIAEGLGIARPDMTCPAEGSVEPSATIRTVRA
jgi:hypothetical protein